MKSFKYKAKKGPTEIIESVLTAESVDRAIDKINELGLVPVDIWEDRETGADSQRENIRAKAIPARELLVFYRQCAKLIRSGVPILQVLFLLSQENERGNFKLVLSELHRKVREGNSLSESLAAFPKIFSVFDVGMIQTGEAAGRLEEVLAKIADYRQKQQEFNSRVRGALAYPAFIMIMGIVTVSFMLGVVIPKFSRFFEDLGQDLPWITRALIQISGWIEHYWPAALFSAAVVFFALRTLTKSDKGAVSLHGLVLKLPLAGKVILKADLARFCRTLELLLKSGIPLLKAMRIAVPVARNHALRLQLESCHRILEEGGYLSGALKRTKLIPSFMSFFIGVGEESGKLDETLHEIADWYEQDTEEAVKLLITLMEPVLILAVGSILGVMIVAVLLPVFSINAMVQ